MRSPTSHYPASPSTPFRTQSHLPLRILTHNIRYATKSPFKGELPWPDRAASLCSQFYHTINTPPFTPIHSILCLQEVLHKQLLDIHSFLGDDEWTYIGRARDDGRQRGEYSPILFRKDIWRVLHQETIWLNPGNVVGRKGWDATCVRVVSVGLLSTRIEGTEDEVVVLVMNTHLDDRGVIARKEAAKMIRMIAAGFRSRWQKIDLVVLAGDLNSEVDGDAYRVLNEDGSGFTDVMRCLDVEDKREKKNKKVYGNQMTFTGFDGRGDGDGVKRIDFVHLGLEKDSNGEKDIDILANWVKGYAVLPNRFDDGIYMSDHRAVMVDIEVSKHIN